MSLRNDFLNGVSTTALSHALLSSPKQAGAIQQSNEGALKLLENKADSEVFYNEQIAYAKQFFARENLQVTDALFDYMIALKANKIRKNGYTPDHAHEIDQLISVITSLERGGLSQDRAAIEAKYGSVGKWLNGIIVHDIGEDFNIMPEDLLNTIRAMIEERYGIVTPENDAEIMRAARSMERLTHYRKYSISDFEKITGTKLGMPVFNEDNIAVLDPAYIDLFAEKMALPPNKRKRMQVFAVTQPNKANPDGSASVKIIVTQYGRSLTQKTPNPDNDYGAEWNAYITELMMTLDRGEEEDFYDFLVKMGDRVQGMGSRIAIQNFTIHGYASYLDSTDAIFSKQNIVKFVKEGLYKGTPLKNAIDSLDGAMSGLESIGRLFINYHPSTHKNGDRGFAVEPIFELMEETGRNALHFSNKIPQTRYIYGAAPARINPFAMIMKELREVTNPELLALGKTRDDAENPETKLGKLYLLIKNAIMENGPEFNALFERHLGSKEPVKIKGKLFGPATITPDIAAQFPHDTALDI